MKGIIIHIHAFEPLESISRHEHTSLQRRVLRGQLPELECEGVVLIKQQLLHFFHSRTFPIEAAGLETLRRAFGAKFDEPGRQRLLLRLQQPQLGITLQSWLVGSIVGTGRRMQLAQARLIRGALFLGLAEATIQLGNSGIRTRLAERKVNRRSIRRNFRDFREQTDLIVHV
jgi:hypothetical protein